MSNKPGFFRQLKDTQNYSTKFLIVLFSPNSGVTPSNSSNEQPTPKKFSLENLANLSKILANVVSIVFHCWKMIFD